MSIIAKGVFVMVALMGTGGLVMVLQGKGVAPKPTWKPVQIELSEPTTSENTYTVWVQLSGEVAVPGLYAASSNMRVKDIVDRAGGMTEKANLNRVNLAKRVKDGLHVHIPTRKTKKVKRSKSKPASGVININTASASDLTAVKGIGPKTAERIIAYRTEHGLFNSYKDLTKVKGIGPKTVDRIRPYLRL